MSAYAVRQHQRLPLRLTTSVKSTVHTGLASSSCPPTTQRYHPRYPGCLMYLKQGAARAAMTDQVMSHMCVLPGGWR